MASRLLTEEVSTLDRMEKTLSKTTIELNKTDRKLTDFSVSINTFNMTGTGSVTNATNTWRHMADGTGGKDGGHQQRCARVTGGWLHP